MKHHKIKDIAKLLKLRLVETGEPTTGQFFAYIGHDDGYATSCNTCSEPFDTEKEALDDLLMKVRTLIDNGGK